MCDFVCAIMEVQLIHCCVWVMCVCGVSNAGSDSSEDLSLFAPKLREYAETGVHIEFGVCVWCVWVGAKTVTSFSATVICIM